MNKTHAESDAETTREKRPDGRLSAIGASGATGLVAAVLAASCCILPILLIAVGVAGAELMATTMRYEWITLPAGVVGLAGAYALYLREKRRCEAAACRFVGRRASQVILGVATLVVAVALLLRLFPAWTSELLLHLA